MWQKRGERQRQKEINRDRKEIERQWLIDKGGGKGRGRDGEEARDRQRRKWGETEEINEKRQRQRQRQKETERERKVERENQTERQKRREGKKWWEKLKEKERREGRGQKEAGGSLYYLHKEVRREQGGHLTNWKWTGNKLQKVTEMRHIAEKASYPFYSKHH